MRLPFAREGYPHIAIALAVTAVSFALHVPVLPWIGLAASAFCLNFFRDPERSSDAGDDCLISPADGRVIKVCDIQDDRFLQGPAKLVCIFMSPLDVHVNRVPADAKVVDVRYTPGSFLRAYADEASLENEQTAVLAERADGRRFCFVQISGFVARRIVNHLKPGQAIRRGERYGMIKFGSRVDLYFPPSTEILVQVGDRPRAGVTPLARWT